jgi:hypothetical protein
MTPILAALFGLGLPELLVIACILGVLLLLSAIPAVLAYIVLNRVPPQFRKQSPGMAFLLLIPIFNIIWSFFVHPKVAESLQAYFNAQGSQAHGDCGGALALWLCICGACSFVPFIGLFAGIAGLVLAILFYVKAFDLSAKIGQAV